MQRNRTSLLLSFISILFILKNDAAYGFLSNLPVDRNTGRNLLREKDTFCRKNKSISEFFLSAKNNNYLELQTDDEYGRGEMHLSAVLDEGDVVIYKTGLWEVDGVQVGDGEETNYEYGIIDTIQVVWTHNCEHGFIRGMKVVLDGEGKKLSILQPYEFIDFGPEQLYARIKEIDWINEHEGCLSMSLPSELR
ncbi:hypothetical protein CTEN210_10937 [Chaetoceros tenuissimus]|uniref:Peptidylprolyl isomerase n=1 Tax=Chaetoceros tenuissimus TaxID=426638 RepID=A0AAD3CYF5_9STRA|nr:hypothetical protein CTEN210_10937 [Chaetoceros tenuissimus]